MVQRIARKNVQIKNFNFVDCDRYDYDFQSKYDNSILLQNRRNNSLKIILKMET